MQKVNDLPSPGGDVSLGELILKFLRFYAEFGKLLVPVALLCSALTAGLVALYPIYRVSALLETSQMPLDQWRRLQSMLSDRTLVAASLANFGLPSSQQLSMQRAFQQPGYWSSRIKYRSTVGRDDVREQINIDPKKVGVLGLEVSLSASGDEYAAQQLEMIVQHIRQVMLWADLSEYLDSLQRETMEKKMQLQIDQIKQQFSIEQSTRQVADMQKLLQQYPELRRSEVNTVVSVGDGGGKYLSPLAQIVALQSTIAETRTAQRHVERELEQIAWRQRFIDHASQHARTLHLGSALAEWLQQSHGEIFPAASLNSDMNAAQRQVGREIQMVLAQLGYKAQQLRYKALPALSAAPIPSRRPLLVAVVVFASTLLMLSLGLVAYMTIRRMGAIDGMWSLERDPLVAWMPVTMRYRLLKPVFAITKESGA